MAVAAVAFYSSSDFEIISRTTPSPSSLPKPFVGGLSSLLSSSPSSAFACKEETRDQPAGAYATTYMSLSSSFKRKDVSSPVSILQGPASSRSPPAGFSGQGSGGHLQSSPNSRCRRGHLLKVFGPNALRSYMDSPVSMVEGFAPTSKVDSSNDDHVCPLYAQELLEEAQSRHRIFNQKFVISAFYTAERAHRGQVSCNVLVSSLLDLLWVIKDDCRFVDKEIEVVSSFDLVPGERGSVLAPLLGDGDSFSQHWG